MVKNEYYVYKVSVDSEVRYIGYGKGDRYLHCYSGRSSCVLLNRDYFFDKDIDVFIYIDNLSKEQAKQYEKEVIEEYKQHCLYNKTSNKFNLPDTVIIEMIHACSDVRDYFGGVSIIKSILETNYPDAHDYWVEDSVCGSLGLIKLRQLMDNCVLFNKVAVNMSLASELTLVHTMIYLSRVYQECLIKQEANIWKAKVAHLLGWEIEAEDMLLAGAKQNDIANKFNKSLSTVKRLAKRLKDEGRL